MVHLLMQVLATSIFNKAIDQMELFLSGQIQRRDSNMFIYEIYWPYDMVNVVQCVLKILFEYIYWILVSSIRNCIPSKDLHAFEVECEFTDEEGRTVLKPEDWRQEGFTFPKTENERCTDPNCFSHIFKYAASSDQLEVWNRLCNNMWLIIEFSLFKQLMVRIWNQFFLFRRWLINQLHVSKM